MLVESVIGNISEADAANLADSIDWLDLTWPECRNRFANKITRNGYPVRLLLNRGQTLKHGDVLGKSARGQTIVVNLLPADVLLIHAPKPDEAVSIAFQIGNLHMPIEISAERMLVPCTSETEAALVKHGIPFQLQRLVFQPTHWPDSVQLSPLFQVIRR